MKRPTPLLRIRFELRGQALKSMAQIIENLEGEIAEKNGQLYKKDVMIMRLQAQLDYAHRCH